ncbi:MAG: hypothetical protein CMM39_12795 [Rhodospirillaceae bacterium]|nr:hypothetical protein [Rhodospirillaceae bacterium]MBT5913156.1 hypothetical protein [Rhodospirillaceae bacterium]MBT6304778.1 hypothetical protein [Rhodospirillaceae bacterium]MDG1887622.1 hypothetical protein [Alphaproteobacteria bacterium]|tara:strand:- start:764 stop:1057 length:294 start_codon:yes stop_codon:yes gene_type:complete
MEIEANKSSTNSALSELLAVANKENQMLRELVEEVRKRAEMSESALQILSNHIEKKSQKETRPSLLQRIIVPIGKAIRIPRRKKHQEQERHPPNLDR